MSAVLGLSTYRWNNNIKSILLLLLFPFLLLALLGGIFLVFGFIYANQPEAGGLISPYVYTSFHLTPVNGTFSPLDFAEAAVIQYWPIITGIAVIWLLLGYFFNDAMI